MSQTACKIASGTIDLFFVLIMIKHITIPKIKVKIVTEMKFTGLNLSLKNIKK